jgi:hypothetical protein
VFRSSYTKMPKGRQESEHPDPQELGGRPWLSDEPDRGAGDRRHEGEELEANVDERTQELSCLFIVDPQPLPASMASAGEYSRRTGRWRELNA